MAHTNECSGVLASGIAGSRTPYDIFRTCSFCVSGLCSSSVLASFLWGQGGRGQLDASCGGRGGPQCFRFDTLPAQRQQFTESFSLQSFLEGCHGYSLGYVATVARTGSYLIGFASVTYSPVALGVEWGVLTVQCARRVEAVSQGENWGL